MRVKIFQQSVRDEIPRLRLFRFQEVVFLPLLLLLQQSLFGTMVKKIPALSLPDETWNYIVEEFLLPTTREMDMLRRLRLVCRDFARALGPLLLAQRSAFRTSLDDLLRVASLLLTPSEKEVFGMIHGDYVTTVRRRISSNWRSKHLVLERPLPGSPAQPGTGIPARPLYDTALRALLQALNVGKRRAGVL